MQNWKLGRIVIQGRKFHTLDGIRFMEGKSIQMEELGLWGRLFDEILTVGVIQELIEDDSIDSVELPEQDADIVINDVIGKISTSAADRDILAPATGIVTEVNNEVLENPSLLSYDSEDDGWLFKMEIQDSSELLVYS